ncbi:hypothetical protein AB0D94_28675 [Streptomyces sp. NPDC048255]|uniref:hypothetical protein n=1 Tax=Streptomyces sp. NPDC048255 TaxID=3154713 RepID=UPI003406B2AC
MIASRRGRITTHYNVASMMQVLSRLAKTSRGQLPVMVPVGGEVRLVLAPLGQTTAVK